MSYEEGYHENFKLIQTLEVYLFLFRASLIEDRMDKEIKSFF